MPSRARQESRSQSWTSSCVSKRQSAVHSPRVHLSSSSEPRRPPPRSK
jgi:hypothetical protein